MLGYEYGNTGRSLIYILTLGVIRPYRNCGIGMFQQPACRLIVSSTLVHSLVLGGKFKKC